MKIKLIKKYYHLVAVILFLFSYLLFYPFTWMITDSYSYALQALAFAQSELSLNQIDFFTDISTRISLSPYNPGTAIVHALFASLMGARGLFLSPLIVSILSIILLSKVLSNLKYSQTGLLVVTLSPAIIFFSRSLMSCMPSLLIVSLFFYVYSLNSNKKLSLFFSGFFFTLSIWFRETNLIILFPFLLYMVYEKPQSYKWILPGIIIGILPKIISTKIIYKTWWFTSASEGFSFTSVIQNTPVYLVILLCLIPLALMFAILYKGRYKLPLLISVILFIGIYLAYNYTAVDYSGFVKGSLLTSRFMIPLIPVIVIAAGDVISHHKTIEKWMTIILMPLSLIFIFMGHFSVKKLYQPHETAAKALYEKYHDKPILYDQSGFTNIIRYINPVVGNFEKLGDLNKLGDSNYLAKVKQSEVPVYMVISISDGNEEKRSRTEQIKQQANIRNQQAIDSFIIDESNRLDVYLLK